MQTVELIGAEQVQRAGHTMREAAADMQRAANEITEAMERNRRWWDEWLHRLEALKEETNG